MARYYMVTESRVRLLYDSDHIRPNSDTAVFNIRNSYDCGENWYLVHTGGNPLKRGYTPSELPAKYRRTFEKLVVFADEYTVAECSDDESIPIMIPDEHGCFHAV